ncbi:PAS domain S-box protein [Corallococcus exiguus]|uniref:sensor histidine kinase n=1 Tax=Corallococcus TaxID=83461 RepID=UPI000EA20EE9|nr:MULTISPECIES: PAS domain S-box protein [Corallococcus]NRD60529.1 PAS domain S-box protein [Corallococcus exiguus]RKH31410.1 PAS domain S-box protein [Corallococcus sp. CA041A]RUO91802.1 PAS domain S-box protein [Corallococcus sp. AB018]
MARLHDSPAHPSPRGPPPEYSSLLDAVLASMGEGLLVADEHQHLVFINPMGEHILGMGPTDEPVSRWPAHFGLYLPDQVTLYPSERLPMSRALRGETVSRAEVFLRNTSRPAGTWLHVSSSPVRDGAGQVRGGASVISDVTDFKRAEDAAREGEEKYRSLYNTTPVMMQSIDPRGRLISVSDYWLSTLGYARAEVLGRESVEFLTPESRRYAREVVLPEYYKTGVCKDVPYQLVKKDGQLIDVLLSAIVERDTSGKMVRSLAVLNDVTERKRTEEALQESEQRLRAILDNAPTVFFLLDTQERFLFVNREWERLFHRTRQQVAGRTVFDVFPRDIAETLHQANRDIFQSRVPVQREERLPHDDGIHVHLTQKFPLLDANGVAYALCGVATDITERKRMEVSQRFLAEASSELVASLDPETTLQRVAELAVPLLAELCVFFVRTDGVGLRPVAVADRSPARAASVREFLRRHPPEPESLHGPARVLATGESEVSEASQGLWDPDELPEDLRPLDDRPSLGVPLQARGRTLGVLYLLSPDPGRTYSPAELALTEELGRRAAFSIDNAQLYCSAQESIRARDEFLSIASHELKTPLTSMRLRVQQMESVLVGARPLSPERVKRMLEVFESQLQRLSHLAEHLLDVSRVNEKRIDLHLEEMDLMAVARHVAGHVAEQLQKAGCEFELVAREPVWGSWDRLRLEQVMLNLLTNAMKYGAGHPIRMEVAKHLGRARLTVEDQGMGIPFESQARIFERFERASSRNYGGLGLGLFITRRIVEAHGGSIRVESEPDHGAKFIVELPPHAA